MLKKIDAHAHIWPSHMRGATNARYQVTYLDYGRVRMSSGEICQMLPAYFHDSCFTADALIHLMDSSGIERAVLLQALNYDMTQDLIAAVKKYPNRLRAAMAIEPDSPTLIQDIEYRHAQGLTVMKFELSEGLGYLHPNAYPELSFAMPVFEEVFAVAERLHMTITIDTSPISGKGYQVEALSAAALAHPGLRFVICHMGFPYIGMRSNSAHYSRWKQMVDLARLPNVWFDISTLPNLFGIKGYPLSITDATEAYPYPSALDFVREFITAYGPKKAIWGSDIPSSLGHCSYPQMADMFEDSPLFTDEEKVRMFYDNAVDAYFT